MYTTNQTSLKFKLSSTEALGRSWDAVKANLLSMAGFTFLYFLISGVLKKIPFIGGFTNLFQFIYHASLFSAFDGIERGERGSSNLFSWTPKFGKLLLANLILYLIAIVLMIPFLVLFFTTIGSDYMSGFSDAGFRATILAGFSWALIIGLFGLVFLGFLVLAILTFAFTFLVQFRDLTIVESLKLSMRVGRENIGEIILFALVGFGVMLLGALALIIGLLVAFPVVFGMQYYMVRSIFPVEEVNKWDFMEGTEPGL
jgi:hypothetical protein